MKCVDQVRELLEKHGASLDLQDHAMYADCRPGYTWRCNGGTTITVVAANRTQSWWAGACKEMLESIKEGMSKCEPEESAQYEYERAEPWTAPADAPETIEIQ